MILLSVFVFICLFYYSQLENKSSELIGIVKLNDHDSIIHHSAYSLSYNSDYHQANWVAYLLTRVEVDPIVLEGKRVKRSNNFIAGPNVQETDLSSDYYKSNYDRGHLAPAGDMAFSKIAMDESFYYTNMSPQVASFNRGVWKKLETQVRNWAIEYDSLYIVTGPIFSDSMKVIGPHRVAVPTAYYKVVLDNHKGKEKVIGFLMRNEGSKAILKTFVLSVDEVEELTGIDFFPLLDDELETNIEREVCFECWKL